MTIKETLEQRHKQYGNFQEHFRIAQNIKRAMVDSPNWETLSDDKRECLDMIANKIGRILNGNSEFYDSWYDIMGYIQLVIGTLKEEIGTEDSQMPQDDKVRLKTYKGPRDDNFNLKTYQKGGIGGILKIYHITPVAKPRMTRSDVWKKRDCVMKYRAFADECRLAKVRFKARDIHITFILPMPKSWSKRKRDKYNGAPHLTTPDLDNLVKGLLDALYDNDSAIWDFRATKLWGEVGAIKITEI